LGKVLSTWNINFSVLSNFLTDPRKLVMLSRTRVISNLAGICQHIQLQIWSDILYHRGKLNVITIEKPRGCYVNKKRWLNVWRP
jgi:hypothetical protein